eukprot:522422_1
MFLTILLFCATTISSQTNVASFGFITSSDISDGLSAVIKLTLSWKREKWQCIINQNQTRIHSERFYGCSTTDNNPTATRLSNTLSSNEYEVKLKLIANNNLLRIDTIRVVDDDSNTYEIDTFCAPKEFSKNNYKGTVLITEECSYWTKKYKYNDFTMGNLKTTHVKFRSNVLSYPNQAHEGLIQHPRIVESGMMNDNKPLCNVIPNSKCPTENINRLPLPFDKPLSAQLSCHKNTCLSPLHLPGQSIISGETYEADRTVMDIEYDIPIKCHLTELNTIHVTRAGYNNNEDWKYCIQISNDNSLLSFPILHITFSLISFDIEQGFDNLFMTTQFNSIYDDYTESWTGNWSTLHRFEPNTWYQNYWMTSSKPNTFIELCLRLQSDESITGKGFISKFSITKEIGYWSEWSICTAHSNTPKIANGACGIGVHRHESYCPKYIVQSMDTGTDRFDWNNGTHSCIHKYSNYPLNKYCIVANCNDIDNDKYAPR